MNDIGLDRENPEQTRQRILELVKREGGITIQRAADACDITREAARLQLNALKEGGWLRKESIPSQGRGRPGSRFVLTDAGEHLFPKHYDALSSQMIELVAASMGDDALASLLAELTDRQVEAWEDRVEGKPLTERLKALESIYIAGDPWCEAGKDERGPYLVEHNCPYLHVAKEHPRMCSVTVSTLERLLGHRVVRERRFQDGDGRCVFRIEADQRATSRRFRFEDE